jgi:hypothetical protein
MTDPDFPDDLRAFLQEYISSVDAAELLVVLARDPTRGYRLGDAIAAMRPTVLSEPAARSYLIHFEAHGLVTSEGGATYRYSPATPALDAAVRALTKAYNERPVTLVRTIYAPKDEKIRSFADAFRLKKP